MRAKLSGAARRVRRALAELRFLWFRPTQQHRFVVVSAVYNAEDCVERCLDSVARQRYDPARFMHVIIDDASSDPTADRVERWLAIHRPSYAVEFVRNEQNRGGCANYAAAFRRAPRDSIVVHLDGDDWLPDPLVLSYLNMVYHDANVWMTYNTWIGSDGSPSSSSFPVPPRVIAANDFRASPWGTSHLHSFRAPLWTHVREESLIDPLSGQPWRGAVDHALYLPMLELAGRHSRHLDRITYVYNRREQSLFFTNREHQLGCDERIRALPRHQPLSRLDP